MVRLVRSLADRTFQLSERPCGDDRRRQRAAEDLLLTRLCTAQGLTLLTRARHRQNKGHKMLQ